MCILNLIYANSKKKKEKSKTKQGNLEVRMMMEALSLLKHLILDEYQPLPLPGHHLSCSLKSFYYGFMESNLYLLVLLVKTIFNREHSTRCYIRNLSITECNPSITL